MALKEILEYNRQFVEDKKYEKYRTDKYPNKKMVILTCMDTRLTELLPKALNISNGDAKIVKSAGAIVSHPFGSIMRSILVAVYSLNAHEVFVIGHHDCGMTGLHASSVLEKAKENGISDEVIHTVKHTGVDIDNWLKGFEDVSDGVKGSVDMIKNHPLFPKNVPVHGLIIDPATGKLDLVVDDSREE